MKNVNIQRVQNIEDVNRELMNIKRLLENTPVLYGNDSPQGQVAASVSSVYHQLNSTGIESLWVKATGDNTTDGWKPLSVIPSGTIFSYAADSAPDGFLLCDGTSYLKTKYPDLFAVIGTSYGTASADYFNVPDFQGRFLRGWDNGQGRDPDAAGRTAIKPGGNTGDNVGSVQDHEIEEHDHSLKSYDDTGTPQYWRIEAFDSNDTTPHTIFEGTGETGGNETRPINAYVNYIIKY